VNGLIELKNREGWEDDYRLKKNKHLLIKKSYLRPQTHQARDY